MEGIIKQSASQERIGELFVMVRGANLRWDFPVKLDRLLAKHESMGRKRARAAILSGRVRVADEIVLKSDEEIDRFTAVELDDLLIRPGERRLHIMLNKPVGVVSATVDAEHRTVIDLIDHPDKGSLHLVGRLDRNTSGLLLLTNDGRWSKVLMDPESKVPKTYLVKTREPILPEAVPAFAAGFYFHTENLTTRPALLEITGECEARVTLHEGRYHQIKRMFHRTGNRVMELHRQSFGHLILPKVLSSGAWRMLEEQEIKGITQLDTSY